MVARGEMGGAFVSEWGGRQHRGRANLILRAGALGVGMLVRD